MKLTITQYRRDAVSWAQSDNPDVYVAVDAVTPDVSPASLVMLGHFDRLTDGEGRMEDYEAYAAWLTSRRLDATITAEQYERNLRWARTAAGLP